MKILHRYRSHFSRSLKDGGKVWTHRSTARSMRGASTTISINSDFSRIDHPLSSASKKNNKVTQQP